jgi:uncharacterized membrane protein YkoI
MTRLTKSILVGSAALGLAVGGFGVAAAIGGANSSVPTEVDEPGEDTDSDTALTGTDLDTAVAAALEHTGSGEVVETEVGDDGAAYGVEIRLDDGSMVEVNLDADFNVIGAEPDGD